MGLAIISVGTPSGKVIWSARRVRTVLGKNGMPTTIDEAYNRVEKTWLVIGAALKQAFWWFAQLSMEGID